MPSHRRPDARSVQERLTGLVPAPEAAGWSLPPVGPAAPEDPAGDLVPAAGPARWEVREEVPPLEASARAHADRAGPPPLVDLGAQLVVQAPGEGESDPAPPDSASPIGWRRHLPAHLVGSRLDPGRPGVLLLVAVCLLSTVASVVLVVHGRAAPAQEPVADQGQVTASPPEVVVDVAGAVARPGVQRLPAGSRIVDALQAAGGPLPGTDTTGLNLARPLQDGEQVLVGAAPAGGGASAASADGRVDLNAADVSALDGLPGVGPVLAQRIVDWRTAHGRFATVDQLAEVSGLGEARLSDLRDRVRV